MGDRMNGWPLPSMHRKKPVLVKVLRLADLQGQRPEKHPALERNKNGSVKLAVGQVLVRMNDDSLWVVSRLELRPIAGPYKYRVWLLPYQSSNPSHVRRLGEWAVREGMKAWEDAVAFRQELIERIVRVGTKPGGRWEGDPNGAVEACRAHGFDTNGCRL
jgi:hypothetical protein